MTTLPVPVQNVVRDVVRVPTDRHGPDLWLSSALKGASAVYSAERNRYAVPRLGPELVTNGGFEANVVGWDDNVTPPLAWSALHSGSLEVDSGASAGGAFQAVSVTAGQVYEIRGETFSDTATGTIRCYDTDAFGGPFVTVPEGGSAFIVAASGALRVYCRNTAGGVCRYKNISIRELQTSSLRSANASDFFQNYSCLTKTWPVGADGLPYEVTAGSPAFTWHTGRKGQMIDPGGTRLNDSRAQQFQGDTSTKTNLPAVGLFDQPLLIASLGAAYHRASQTIAWTAGVSVWITLQYEAGSSGRARIVIRDTSGTNDEARFTGPVGALNNDLTQFGTVDHWQQYELANGHHLVQIKFTPDVTASGSIGIGPDTTVIGEDITLYAMQVRDQGFGWIFGDQTQQVAQGGMNNIVNDLIETLLVGNDASVFIEFNDAVGVSGANGLFRSSSQQFVRFNSAGLQIALAVDTYTSMETIAPPTSGKVAFGVEDGVELSGSYNGNAAVTDTTASASFPSASRVMGQESNGVCGVLYTVAFWDRQLSDAELQAVTS